MKKDNGEYRQVSVWYALSVLIAILILVVGGNKIIDAPIEAMFLVSWLIVYPACMRLGYTYQEINESVMESCRDSLGAFMILMSVGAVISTWMAAGTVPVAIYYGLSFVDSRNFLLVTFLLNSCVGLLSGTSWGTMGTIGVAMFTVGTSLGIPSGMTVGAIVSAACMGNFISPMGDSSNIVCASCRIDLNFHCKKFSKIVFPTMVISCAYYYYLGVNLSNNSFETAIANDVRYMLSQHFEMGFIPFAPIVLLLIFLVSKQPAMLSMLVSAISALVIAVVYQGTEINNTMDVFWCGYAIETGNLLLDAALNRGGVRSMLDAGCILLFASGVIGAFKRVKILDAIVTPLVKRVKSTAQLITTTQLISFAGSLVGTATFALLMVGSLMLPTYKKFNLHPVNLSIAVCATSVPLTMLIPWNISCVYVVTLFDVDVCSFAPHAVLAYLVPVAIFLCAVLRLGVLSVEDAPEFS